MSRGRQFLEVADGDRLELRSRRGATDRFHVFTGPSVHAVNAALAAERPLLVRGEPGVGKSQLARAVAEKLGWAFVSLVVDSRTEARDLSWRFDAVARLAKAQLAAAYHEVWRTPEPPKIEVPGESPSREAVAGSSTILASAADITGAGGTSSSADPSGQERLDARLADWLREDRFVHPGPLWWAFDWEDAVGQARLVGMIPPQQLNEDDYQRGCVVLIDEIDKAESDVPNGLLEALGDRRFLPLGRSQPIEARDRPLLVMITTNEERTLPDAFLRRCLVLPLELPHETKKRDEFEQLLIDRGDAHFNHRGDDQPQVSAAILQEAAEMVAADRADARSRHLTPLPGQAEYLDLVRAVDARRPGDEAAQRELLAQIRGFVLKKQLEVQA